MNNHIHDYSSHPQKPTQVTALAIITLVSGILNISLGVGLIFTFMIGIVTIVCIPLAAFPITLGILEIIYAARLIPDPPKPVAPAQYLAVLEIISILFLNVAGLITGILALIFYNDERVISYFNEIAATESYELNAKS